jgi:hypothetical protein
MRGPDRSGSAVIERVFSSQNRLICGTRQDQKESKGFAPSPLEQKKAIVRAGWQSVLEAGIVVGPSLSRVVRLL